MSGGRFALRLGLRQVRGLKEEDGRAIVAARGAVRGPTRAGSYTAVDELWRRAGVGTAALSTLAEADAFASLGLDRRGALWAIRALGHEGRETAHSLPLFAAADDRDDTPRAAVAARGEAAVALPAESAGEAVASDYTALRLSLKHHPLTLLRALMERHRVARNETLVDRADGAAVTVAGLVLVRQRPGSASGVIFLTLEDDSGVANVIVWPKTYERFRKAVLGARLLRVDGVLQREGIVTHVIARRLVDMSDDLDALASGEATAPLAFANQLARADEVKRGPDCGPADPGIIGKRVRRLPPANPRRHPRDNHIRIASRDFH